MSATRVNDSEQMNLDNVITIRDKINVVKMEFVEADIISWKDLFSGYDKLFAITYSSGIGFVCDLLSMFQYSEIIFGYEAVMSYNMHEVMAFQLKTVESIRTNMNEKKQDLVSKIKNESLKMYIAREKVSHEKIYLLESLNGSKRTVFGSANMSRAAFMGIQRENICYIDGDRAFDWYMNSFQEFKTRCSDNISIPSLREADEGENINEIPILKTAKVNKVLTIEPLNEAKDDVHFILGVNKLANKFSAYTPKEDKKGKILILPETVVSMRKKIIDGITQEKELRSEYPQLVVDVNDNQVYLNNAVLDLAPSRENIHNDVELFIQYMTGFERFHGDSKGMQLRYFEFANWFFATPFMAALRNTAAKNNHKLEPYPVFGLLYGQSKAGKTSFLETLLKMMIGQKPKISAPDFTRSSIENLKTKINGAPIIVDDLTQTRFTQHAVETIKNEDFGIRDNLLFYPAVVISANEDIKAVAPEIIRRVVICRVQAGLTNTEVMQSNVVRRVQKNISTAFYREYLRKMLDILPEHIENLKSDENNDNIDIFNISSKIICEIIKEHYNGEMPFYIREVTLADYFNEKVTGAYAIKAIRNAWTVSKKSFVIDIKLNLLKYNAGQNYEADRLIKELPEDLESHKVREYVVMNLEKACEYFKIDFKKKNLIRRLLMQI